jgi:hypothetical protein
MIDWLKDFWLYGELFEHIPARRELTILLFAWLIGMLVFVCVVKADTIYSDDDIVNAIEKAENSTKYPYGIISLKYENRTNKALNKHDWAKMICLNTVKHARKDWNGKGDFIEFLGNRYCPVGCDNDNGNNKYWVKNVKAILKKEGH